MGLAPKSSGRGEETVLIFIALRYIKLEAPAESSQSSTVNPLSPSSIIPPRISSDRLVALSFFHSHIVIRTCHISLALSFSIAVVLLSNQVPFHRMNNNPIWAYRKMLHVVVCHCHKDRFSFAIFFAVPSCKHRIWIWLTVDFLTNSHFILGKHHSLASNCVSALVTP